MAVKLIAYLRVSTKQQGDAGLGLAAQRMAVEQYAQANHAEVIAWYQEIESGRSADRPQLAKALSHVRRLKAKLVVAKLDRLARNVAFLAQLMENKTPFVCCDNPNANEMVVHVLAAMAQYEAEMISKRTKEGLAAAKAKGVLLGSLHPRCKPLTESARRTGVINAAKSRTVAAEKYWRDFQAVAAEMIEWKRTGKTLQEIADLLNARGETTRRGKSWTMFRVCVVLNRVTLPSAA